MEPNKDRTTSVDFFRIIQMYSQKLLIAGFGIYGQLCALLVKLREGCIFCSLLNCIIGKQYPSIPCSGLPLDQNSRVGNLRYETRICQSAAPASRPEGGQNHGLIISKRQLIQGEGATYVAQSTILNRQDDQLCIQSEQIDERKCTALQGTAKNLCLARTQKKSLCQILLKSYGWLIHFSTSLGLTTTSRTLTQKLNSCQLTS